jgi:protein involved in polysaccharide export with SLBB domain
MRRHRPILATKKARRNPQKSQNHPSETRPEKTTTSFSENMKSAFMTLIVIMLICVPDSVAAEGNAAPKLQPGEHCALTIRRIPNEEIRRFNGRYRVDLKGGITIPYAGRIQVEGLTIEEAQKAMEDSLMNKGIFRRPEIHLEPMDEIPLQKPKKADLIQRLRAAWFR